MDAGFAGDERRLGDRILHALELALDQQDLEVAEMLCKALETALTRFGGRGIVEHRPVPEPVLTAFCRFDQLRHAKLGGSDGTA